MRKARDTQPGFVLRTTSGKAKWSLILALLVVTALPALVLGLLALRDIRRSRGLIKGREIARAGIALSSITLSVVLLLGLLYLVVPQPGSRSARADTKKSTSPGKTNPDSTKKTLETTKKDTPPKTKPAVDPGVASVDNMKKISSAFKAYHEAHKSFPRYALSSGDGTPLLSWRVQLLRYFDREERELYNQFKLDEPWDGPHNAKLLEKMPAVYGSPRFPDPGKGKTYIQGFTGPKTVLGNPTPLTLSFIQSADGAEQTLLVVEAGEPVPWTKPVDLSFQPTGPLPAMGGPDKGDFLGLFADGKVKGVPKSTKENVIRAYITWNGGEEINEK